MNLLPNSSYLLLVLHHSTFHQVLYCAQQRELFTHIMDYTQHFLLFLFPRRKRRGFQSRWQTSSKPAHWHPVHHQRGATRHTPSGFRGLRQLCHQIRCPAHKWSSRPLWPWRTKLEKNVHLQDRLSRALPLPCPVRKKTWWTLPALPPSWPAVSSL